MTKRILSIDGGGIKGVFPASFLATVEDSIGCHVADYFDLITGVSTGGILALGLGLRMPAEELLGFYEKKGPKIFPANRFSGGIRSIFRAKYRREPLEVALLEVFGNNKLGDSKTRLVIPSANLETGEVHVFKTSHHPRLKIDFKRSMVEIALATSAAPVYFPFYSKRREVPLIDGGVWANNPIAVAAVEALSILEWDRPIEILSLSCTSTPLDIYSSRRTGLGIIHWCWHSTDLFMTMQSQSALGMAQLLVGENNVLRIDRKFNHGRFRLDGSKEINSLAGIGSSEARKALPELERRFFNRPAEEFIPENKLQPYHDAFTKTGLNFSESYSQAATPTTMRYI